MPRLFGIGRRVLLGFACLSLCVAEEGAAQIYRWVDANGKMHFTQNLASVPPAHRAAAKARAEGPKPESPIQTYDAPPPPSRISRQTARRDATSSTGRVHKIRVERLGSSMRAWVRINDELDVPFVIDTGATFVTIPLMYATQLGLEHDGPGVRKIGISTANGLIEAPVTMLDSVKLGTARVDNVKGIIVKDMDVGLLGLSFFHHFNYNVDASRGVLTLTENSLAEDGYLRGGRGKNQWISEFRAAHQTIEAFRARREEVPFGRSREREQWEERIEQAQNRLELLEAEADQARVPFSWRD